MDSWDESIGVYPCLHRLANFSVDTLDKMKAALPSLERYASPDLAEETFSELYHWAFTYMKGESIKKVVDLDVIYSCHSRLTKVAVPLLEVLFAKRENMHICHFLEFLKQTPPPVKSLNKDQWDSFYVFSKSLDEKFSDYSEDAAWPILIDEYVAWRRKQVGIFSSYDNTNETLRLSNLFIVREVHEISLEEHNACEISFGVSRFHSISSYIHGSKLHNKS